MGATPPVLPRTAQAYVYAVAVAGAAVAGIALALLPQVFAQRPGSDVLLGALVGCVALVLVQLRGLSLAWKGRHISVYVDEAVLFVCFVFLEAPLVILLSLVASVSAMTLQRKPLVKATFNTSGHVLAVGIAALAFHQGLALGLAPMQAAVVVPIVASAVNALTVATLLTLIAGERLRTTFKAELVPAIALPAIAGVAVGSISVLLLQIHVLVALVVLPVAYVLFHHLASGYKVENELAARRVLSGVSRRLVGESSEDAIVRAAFDASRQAFTLRRMRVRLEGHGREPREWDLQGDFPDQGQTSELHARLLDKDEQPIGELVLTVAHENAAQRDAQQALAEVVAGYLSIALGTSHALRSLAEAETRLRDVLGAAKDPIFLLDERGHVIYHNAAAERDFGLDAREGGDADAALHASLEPSCRDEFDAWLARGADDATPLEVSVPGAAPGEQRVFDLNMSPIMLQGGGRGLIVLARDITQRRLAEASLRRSERLSSLGTLVAGVAHEINNPLAFMRLSLEMSADTLKDALAQPDLSPGAREAIEGTLRDQGEVLAGIDRIARITRSLKEVAKPEIGDRAPQDVNALVENVLTVAGPRLKANTRVVRDLRARGLALVSSNEMSQVLLNLVFNAADALAAAGGGTLTVRTLDARGGGVLIEVEDDGPGIPEQVHAKLFTPFFTTKAHGTGLGLSISYRIVEEHGGRLSFVSKKGRTVFRTALPAAPDPLAQAGATPQAEATPTPQAEASPSRPAIQGGHTHGA